MPTHHILDSHKGWLKVSDFLQTFFSLTHDESFPKREMYVCMYVRMHVCVYSPRDNLWLAAIQLGQLCQVQLVRQHH